MKKKTKSKQQKRPTRVVKKKQGVMKKIMNRFKKAVQKKSVKRNLKKIVKKSSRKVSKKVSKKVVKKSSAKVSKRVSRKLKVSKPMKKSKILRGGKKAKVSPKKATKRVLKSKASKLKTHSKAKFQPKAKVQPKTKVQAVQSQPAAQVEVQTEVYEFNHEPVLVREVMENLQLADKKVVVDGTLGLGGHSKAMLEQMGPESKLIAFDVDDDNMARARKTLISFGDRVVFVRSNFSNLQEELTKLGVKSVDAILLDLGLSSPQVDNAEKGFSFLREGPLDMRFDKSASLTAAEVVNSYGQNELIRIFQQYGEEPFARKIAQEITRRRKARSFKTTTELANFIEKLIGRKSHLHPATRVFQALRIEVNHELEVLLSALQQAVAVLKKHGRLVVIAYHSLEDRVVKQFFKEQALAYINEPDKLTTTHLNPTLHIVTKKPIVPTDAEISKNPRSRSAKLRVAEKL